MWLTTPLRPAADAGLRPAGADRGRRFDRLVDARAPAVSERLAADRHGQRELQRRVADGHARLDRAADRRSDRRLARSANAQLDDLRAARRRSRGSSRSIPTSTPTSSTCRKRSRRRARACRATSPRRSCPCAIPAKPTVVTLSLTSTVADREPVVADHDRHDRAGVPTDSGRLVRHARRQRHAGL